MLFRNEFAITMAQQLTITEERRASERFPVRLPVIVLDEKRNTYAFTRDISAQGIFFYFPSAESALIGQDLNFIVEFPPELTLCGGLKVRCTGTVVRKQNTAQGEIGLAAQIHKYAFLPVAEQD